METTQPTNPSPVLSVKEIDKQFPGVKALKKVSVDFYPGQIHAICGENGAGKSTLMHVIAGVYKADSGTVTFEGNNVSLASQHEANLLGISIVFQERSLVPGLTIGENIFAGRQPTNRWGGVDWKRLHEEARLFLKELNLDLDPRALVSDIPTALQQMVEIAKALSVRPRVLILDEPTATVTERESEALFKLLKKLREDGMAIVYISHRLVEIFQIADKVTVLKDGAYMGTEDVSSIDEHWIIKRMVGRDLYITREESHPTTQRILEVENLSDGRRFKGVSFHLNAGEILTFSGLVGAGRTDVFRVLFGLTKKVSGSVKLFGKPVNVRSPSDAIRAGLGYLPEDRKEQGLFLEMAVSDNIIASSLKKCSTLWEIDRRKVESCAEEYRERLSIATPSIHQKVLNLSGGNQQKVVLAKWLVVNPKILIVDEPTRGVDVGAKLEIYTILRKLRDSGTSIIVVSSDLPEVLSLSDRIYVMCNGRIQGEMAGNDANEEMIMAHASGLTDVTGQTAGGGPR